MDGAPTPLHELFAEWGACFEASESRILPAELGGSAREYHAAREGCALFDGGDRGWVEIAGPDARDFLQRLLSSDLHKLEPGAGQWSALLDRKGKWVADLLVYQLPRGEEEGFGLDCPAQRATVLAETLGKMHFGESLRIEGQDPARLLVAGAAAPAVLRAAGVTVEADAELSARPWGEGLVLTRPDRGTACRELLGERDDVVAIARELHGAGARPGGTRALEMLRVAGGRPRYGVDFDDETSLPEANEWQRASLSKGCYTGQEVVARINTYGECPRQLVRLVFEPSDCALSDAELRGADGEAVGRVTSWAKLPDHEGAVGLGVVRRQALEAGERLTAVSGGTEVEAVPEIPHRVFG